MKRKTGAIALVLVLLVGIFALGCGGNGENGGNGGNGGDGGNTGSDGIDYNGTININLPQKDFKYEDNALQAVADAYMDKHPQTTINIVNQPSSTYKEWLDSQFAGGSDTTSADIVQTLLISNAYTTSRLVDYSTYLVKPNPYHNNTLWKDVLQPDAYPLYDDRSGIYELNFSTNMSMFFYNKEIWKAAGLVENGVDMVPETWDELVEFAKKIKETANKYPLAIGGATYVTGSTSWLFNVYGDQYYRDLADDVHAQAGDYCYDPDIDATWSLDLSDPDLDAAYKYTQNPLRFFNGVMEGEWTPSDARYQGMLENFKKLMPTYTQPNMTTNNYYQAEEYFWSGDAAMVFNTTEFFNSYKTLFDSRPEGHKFEIGYFPAPPMQGTGDKAPASQTVRSVGGAVGWYGVVKKDRKQNDLVMDFMMFWGSKEGQDIYNESIRSQDAYVSGASLVNSVEVTEDIYPAADIEFPGLCHNNPVGNFWGNIFSMNGSSSAYMAFESACKRLFDNNMSVLQFGEQMTKAIQAGIPQYLKSMGWRENAWQTPSQHPAV